MTEEQTEERRRSGLPWALALAALIALNTFALVRWARLDTRPAAWDEAIHTRNAFEYRDRLAEGSFAELMRPVYFNYPPLFNLTMIPFLPRVADVADAGAAVNVFYLAFLVVLCYQTGRLLLDRWAGLAAAILIGFYPIIIHLSRQTMLDLALTAWVAAAFFALLKSESFSRAGWSAAFGGLLGLGMLTKWTAAVYLVGPAAPALWVAARRRDARGPLVALVVLAAVIAPWYALNAVPMLSQISYVKDLQPASGLELGGWKSALWYPSAMFEQINLPFFLLFAVGAVVSSRRREMLPVFLWLLIPMVLWSLIRNHNVRYMMPSLPAVALLTAACVAGRRWAFGAVTAVALAFFAVFHFGAMAPVTVEAAGLPLRLYTPAPPLAQDWRHGPIIERVRALRNADAPFSRVVVVSNNPYLHSTTLNVTVRRMGADDFAFRGPSKRRWLDFAEFILLKTGDLGPAFTIGTIKPHADWIASAPAWFGKVYKERGRWPLPDGSEAILYHAEPDPVPLSSAEMMSVRLGEVRLPRIVARDVDIRADARSPSDTAVGRLNAISIRAGEIDYDGVVLGDVRIELIRPQINVPRYKAESELQILALDRLSVSGTLKASTLESLAAEEAEWLTDPRVLFEDDTIVVSGKVKGALPIRIEAQVHVDGEFLRPALQSVSVAGLPLPLVFVRAITDRPIQLSPNREWPFRINPGRIVGSNGELRVGAE